MSAHWLFFRGVVYVTVFWPQHRVVSASYGMCGWLQGLIQAIVSKQTAGMALTERNLQVVY